MIPTTSYPLTWPVGWPRMKPSERIIGHFRAGLATTVERIRDQVRLMKGSGVLISSNLVPRADGFPYAEQAHKRIQDPGVAVYCTVKNQPLVFACDRYSRADHNLCAIALHVEALRGLERWGVGTVERAFSGYLALPARVAEPWRAVFGFGPNQNIDIAELEATYRALVKLRHPDTGGSNEEFLRLNDAMAAAEFELRMEKAS